MKIQAFDVQKISVFNSPKGKNEKKYLESMEADYPGIGAWVEKMLEGGMKKLSLRNKSGHTITAYTACTAEAPKAVVILLHGYNGCAMQMMPYAKIYLENVGSEMAVGSETSAGSEAAGFAVILPNFENHGDSEGDKTQFGWQEKHDVDLWIREAEKLYPGAADRIILHGVSMGGATSMLCSRHKNVVAVIDDCGYSALPAQIRHESKLAGMKPLPFTFLFSLANFARAGWFLGQVRPIIPVRYSSVPTLFIHGTADKKVPSWMAERLYSAKLRGPKDIWLAPNATHAKSLLTYPEEYRTKVLSFLKANDLF